MESIIHDIHGLLDLVRSGKIEPITMWRYYVSQWDEEEQRIFLLKLIAISKNEKEEDRQGSDVDKWASYHASYLSRKINGQHNNKERNSNDITIAENDINGKPIYKLQNQNASRRNRWQKRKGCRFDYIGLYKERMDAKTNFHAGDRRIWRYWHTAKFYPISKRG